MNQMARVTLQDVANAAGVSKMTASRALRAHSDASDSTKERVTKLAEEMGYIPNQMASMLSSKSSPIIPMIVPSLSNIVFLDIVENAQALLHEAGYQMMLMNTNYLAEKEEQAITSLLAWSPAALLITGVEHTDQTRLLLNKAPFPVIEMMDITDNPIDVSVGFNHYEAGATMGRYLLEKGYQNIAYCGHQLEKDRRAHKRYEGFRDVLVAQGRDEPVVVNSNSDYGVLLEQDLKSITQHESRIDCVYFSNDDLAVSALLMCQRLGISVPETLAIAGFNDIAIGRQTTPSLTTTQTPRGKIGAKAAESAINAVRGEVIADKVIDLGSQLLPRESA